MSDEQSRVDEGRAFADRMREGVRNLTAPDEIRDDWIDWVQEAAFEAVWARPGLALRERSIATIAALTALYRSNELRSHVRIGLRNGLTRLEISEVIMQMGVYGGAPVAVEGMRIAQEVFEQLDA